MKNQWVIVLILSTVIISVAFVPFIFQVFDTPSDKVFIGTHNNALDYPMFIDTILQSARGRWTVLVKYTTEEQPGTLIYPLYIFVGKIAGLFNINPVLMYHLTRFVMAYVFCFSVYYFISYVFTDRKKRLLAFFLVLYSAGFLTANGPNLPWWTGGDVFRRAVFLPHGVLKNVLLLLILVWMGKLFEGKNSKYFVWSCIGGFFLGLLDPMNTMAIWGVLGVWLLGSQINFLVLAPRQLAGVRLRHVPYGTWLRAEKTFVRLNRQDILYFLIYFLFSGAALLYTKIVFDVTPWSVVREWEAKQIYSVNLLEYANHIGITFYFGILGVLLILRKYRNFQAFCTVILTIPTIIFIVTNIGSKVGLSGLRFFQIPVYVFLAMGTSYLAVEILKKKTLIIVFCAVILLISFPLYKWSLNDQLNEFKAHWGNIYVDKNVYDAGIWLKDHVPLDSNVMTDFMAGTTLVAISGNGVYIGHPVSTINFEAKKILTEKFYGGQMSKEEAKRVLIEGRINYVLGSWGEQNTLDSLKYPFLKKIYTGNNTAIYEVGF